MRRELLAAHATDSVVVVRRGELVQHPRTPALDALPAPRLKVRLYHDAKAAEVIEFQHARRFAAVYPYPNPEMRQPDEKAQVNRFLGEYLSMCLACGGALEEPLLMGV
jgi:uncharacterized protein